MKSSLRWHGGKGRLASWIVSLMPKGYIHYVEGYAGGLSVLFANNPEGISEVVNDLDGELMNFWRTLQNVRLFQDFKRLVEAIPFSETEFENENLAFTYNNDLNHAIRFFVRCRQSLAGRGEQFSPLTKVRTRRGMNGEVSAWLSAVEGLAQVHSRLKRVVVLNGDALEVIKEQDGEKTLFYLDPPYLSETRTSPDVYEHECDKEHHEKLLELLTAIKGKFMLSGYHSELYDEWSASHGFTCHEKDVPNNAAGGKVKRRMTECVYTNY